MLVAGLPKYVNQPLDIPGAVLLVWAIPKVSYARKESVSGELMVPLGLVALMVTGVVPTAVGVPLISPVAVSRVSPGGNCGAAP